MASKRECRDKLNSLGPRSAVEKKAKKKKGDWEGEEAGVTSSGNRNERDLSPHFFSGRTVYSLLNEDMIVAVVIAI